MTDFLKDESNASGSTAWADRPMETYDLRLYVAGNTSKSILAIRNIRHLCEKHLRGNYELQVIDIYQHPEVAAQAQIIAAPTLIKLSPEPRRRAIGDMSNENKVLFSLNLPINGNHGS
jgi:circadian clock protein KaiB